MCLFITYFMKMYRGKKGLEMLPSYDKSVKSLAAFTEVALRSVEIPMAATEDIPAASTE